MEKKLKSFIVDLLETVGIALVIVFILLRFIVMSVEVEGSSMEPTLHTDERGVSFIISKNTGIDRFDICVIDPAKTTNLLVKRVIGLPGETVKYEDSKLYIDGEYVEEAFLAEDVITGDLEISLGDDEYFCLGDNRKVSRDSRYYGPFKKSEIKATNIFVYYPLKDLGIKK